MVAKSSKRGPGSRALAIVQKYFPEVKRVADAKANINVEVTKRDDTVATRKAHKSCAMAVACKRKMHLDGVIISVNTAYMIKGNKAIRFKMTQHAAREIVSFDRGGGFAVGTYQLNKPVNEEKIGADKGSSHTTGPHTGKPKKHYALTSNIRTVLGSQVE